MFRKMSIRKYEMSVLLQFIIPALYADFAVDWVNEELNSYVMFVNAE